MEQQAHEEDVTMGLVVETKNEAGVLHQLTGVIARAGGNITWVAILDSQKPIETVFFEIGNVESLDTIIEQLSELPAVVGVAEERTLKRVFGKRLIIIGGGAQVGQVAVGAVSEADRHNLRGERISVDTIPLVGEKQIAEAVKAVARLPRARALVLAGAIMGGEIEKAVTEVREKGSRRHLPQYGGKRSRCRRSRRQRPDPGWCDGGHGDRRYCCFRCPAFDQKIF